ncbi:MAG: hypothetical protein M5R36_14590 [Deltaproteobacteria bacterium]|nr:hypothetical protein [Deltaproteobacteria bacterium]
MSHAPIGIYIGDFDDHLPMQVLLSLARVHETGALLAARDRVIKRIFFDDGDIVFVESSLARESLFRHLIEAGAIEAGAIEAGRVAEARPPMDQAFDAWLAAGGFVDAEAIRAAYAEIVRRRLGEFLSWSDGQFVFLFEEKPAEDLSSYAAPVSVVDFLFADAGHARYPSVTKKLIARLPAPPLVTTASAASLSERCRLEPWQQAFLSSFDGGRTALDAVFAQPVSPDRTVPFFFFAHAFGAVDVPDESPAAGKAPAKIDDETQVFVDRLLHDAPALMEKIRLNSCASTGCILPKKTCGAAITRWRRITTRRTFSNAFRPRPRRFRRGSSTTRAGSSRIWFVG